MRSGTKYTILSILCTLALLSGLLPRATLAAPPPQQPHPPFTVTNQGDDVDANLGNDKCNARGPVQGCTLRAAIQEANTIGGDREIRLEPGTYTLTRQDSGGDEDFAATGDLDLRANITFIVEGGGTAVVQAGPTGSPAQSSVGRVFHIFSGASVKMEGLVIEEGTFTPGGGILNFGSLNLRQSTVRNNSNGSDSSGSGGIVNNGTMIIFHTDIHNNSNALNAGGILNNGSLKVQGNSTIRDNSGSGIINQAGATLEVEGSAISGNRGDGISNAFGATLLLDETTVDGNHTVHRSPGSRPEFGNGISNLGNATVSHSAVSGNESSGIVNSGQARLILTNSTISGNQATGLVNRGAATADLNMVTITENRAVLGSDGGGITNQVNSGAAPVVRLANTIVGHNTNPAASSAADCAGVLTSLGYNLVEVNGGCIAAPQPGDQFGLDPRLAPLANNGGKTKTHAFLVGSQAVERGNPAPPNSSPAACTVSLAQNGVFRILDSDGDHLFVCDIGAFEQP